MTATCHLPRRVVSLASCLSILAGCGQTVADVSSDAVASPPAPTPAELSADAVLTTVPPLNVEFPELFNEQGCAISQVTPALDDLSTATQEHIIESLPAAAQEQIEASGQVDLDSISPGQLGSMLEAQATEVADCNMRGDTPRSPSEFYGYVGHSANTLAAGTVDVDTVATDDGTWGVRGHAVAAGDGGVVTVTATLLAADGSRLATVQATSPVRGARPGEAVPFELDSDVAASNVVNVDYVVTDSHAPAIRSLAILIEGVVADGDNSVILGSINNASESAVSNPSGVVAVTAPSGELLAIAEFDVTEPGSTTVMTRLEPGLSGTFDVTIADPSHLITANDVEVWAFAS